ncbi:NDP-sugar epimerase, includes UDP-GlcNAc-inverting 4,6-dehydratase FlaA1 and capsular polysaccharide biosynthesis protein EpsC [Halobacillus alkaliphilus]|uniref:NDP-sugar epimerase, includes UDP-GlcNAc-inverting 4,6-dehydratase FlaA1 and capsular polysaccharide biosynthesis protein EpsC n=1 Tax=Halobacillus alkaliphilus TaxID=396056 RepID=A0A1I2JX98_9BACI|nr:nucleoside-diphosphate sugar epimerase/dehydratase [Halobacillus alkaliphilus]SFF58809.1 NDP-sugar epimerase, includes UDP-GlcNAc-inverting 4,6-dehydratase FlaA1 and capsular polysaccharide biosynthesis protein EpsC [Halobacillus alkaliphilus]
MFASQRKRLILLILIDSIIVSFSIYMSHFFLNPYVAVFDRIMLVSAIILLLTHHLFSAVLGMYKKKWRYASMEELIGIIVVVSLSILSAALVQFVAFSVVYERALAITWMLHVLLIGGVRFAWRYYKTYGLTFNPKGKKARLVKNNPNMKQTLIVGAGSAGRMLARQMKGSKDINTNIVGFIDDDFTMHHLSISGLPVLGSSKHLKEVVNKHKVNHIVIAMPSIKQSRIKEIIKDAKSVVSNIQTLPMIEDIALGNVSVNQIRDVQIEDLLGREPVDLDINSIQSEIKGRTVMVTGAGGSIGSEICRQLVKFGPKQLILLGHGENSIYTIHMELKQLDLDTELVTVIADVQDLERIFQVVQDYAPSYIYHAAAHKHVPLMEVNPKEAVKNNVIGTKNVAEAAHYAGVKAFVLVSTDKAVNPPNVMGATKRIAEMVVQNISKKSHTKFVAVRFGNVLGSRGSVIPLFKKQIAAGGPVTVTHPDMTRYFMTIPEASRLVLQAGALARGGEVFVLDMGEPVRIVDLAKNLIHLSGFTEEQIPIQFNGIRPGEKMYEELLSDKEVNKKPVFPKIFIGKTVEFEYQLVQYLVDHHLEIKVDDLKEYAIDLANNRLPNNAPILEHVN